MAKKETAEREIVPSLIQDGFEAQEGIAEIGEAISEIEKIEADCDNRIAAITAAAEVKIATHMARLEKIGLGLKHFADKNRERLTGGERKSVEYPTGVIGWRQSPPSVRLTNEEKAIAAAEDLGFLEFIRVKEEFNKQAALADPDKARKIKYVKIKKGEEVFFVKPSVTTTEAVAEAKSVKLERPKKANGRKKKSA